jgi:hypothetical protein
MLSVPAVHLDDGGFVTIGIGICGRAAECLSPVSGESLDMLGVEAVAERMGDHVVGHHPTVPGVGKTAQAVDATRRLEDSLHASMMTILPCLCKVSGEATFSLDANRHVMNQRRRLAITNSLPVTENWTRVAQMAHFVANRCHTPINPATIGRISPGMATAPSYRSLAISSNSLLLSISVAFESISMEPPVER